MKKKIISLWIRINILRSLPALFVFKYTGSRDIIIEDINRWAEVVLKDSNKMPQWKVFHFLLLNFPEFRNLFYYRVLKTNFIAGRIIQPLYPRIKSLYIKTKDIGPGFVIYHGFSTIISAKRIGKNCSVGQQVTIGKVRDNPIIGDGVSITAGAIVVGGLTIGNNSIVGANATVTKNVPENCVVVGNPSYIVRRNGIKTKESL